MDNVFIERLWRSVKYEGVLLWEAKDGVALRQILKNWFDRYNNWRPHQALGYRTQQKQRQEIRKKWQHEPIKKFPPSRGGNSSATAVKREEVI